MQTALLVSAIALAAYLPIATELLLRRLQRDLRARAAATPLVAGAVGSRIDLTLHALYFATDSSGTIPFGVVERTSRDGHARAIPLAAHHTAKGTPLVGTTLDYFDYRALQIAEGRPIGRLGECVLGWRVARRLGLGPGDHLLTDTESFVELVQYPLRLRVVGVFAPSESADDEVIFCDVKTVWVIDGIGHGHQDLESVDEPGVVLERSEREVIAGAALKQYLEITPQTESSFHFHGEMKDFPITAAIVLPRDQRSATILLGRDQQGRHGFQLVQPLVEIESLLQTVFQVKHLLDVAALLIGCSTVLLIGLVVMLSLKLRAAEMLTLFKLGCRRATTARLVAAELTIVAGVAVMLLVGMLATTAFFGPALLKWWLLSVS